MELFNVFTDLPKVSELFTHRRVLNSNSIHFITRLIICLITKLVFFTVGMYERFVSIQITKDQKVANLCHTYFVHLN